MASPTARCSLCRVCRPTGWVLYTRPTGCMHGCTLCAVSTLGKYEQVKPPPPPMCLFTFHAMQMHTTVR